MGPVSDGFCSRLQILENPWLEVNWLEVKHKGERMRTRMMLLLVLLSLLSACSSAPNSNPDSSAVWDQSNFETTNWN